MSATVSRVVAIGGGTGLSTLLRGLKNLSTDLTAVVTVTDDGGSSGRLREEMGMPPPGDVRNCLVALADDESLLSALFSYRFASGAMAGHSFGNLFLAALTEVTGDFERAIEESGKVLAIRGTVLPSTTVDVRLHAETTAGCHLTGETTIGRSPIAIKSLWLEPADAGALPLALERIAAADVVVLGPGSLFTSVLPNLLITGLRDAVAATSAVVVYVVNVMTQPGETTGLEVLDHLDMLIRYVGLGVVDVMLANDQPVPDFLCARYAADSAEPLVWSHGETEYRGVRVVSSAMAEFGDHVRHDPARLAEAVTAAAADHLLRRAGGTV